MANWVPLNNTAALQSGGKYRSTYYLKVPYTASLADTIRQAIHGSSGVLSVAGVSVLGVGIKTPDQTVQTPGGRYTRWSVIVEWIWRKG